MRRIAQRVRSVRADAARRMLLYMWMLLIAMIPHLLRNARACIALVVASSIEARMQERNYVIGPVCRP